MKILACFKIVHDVENLSAGALRRIGGERLDLTGMSRMFGGYDEAALETALVLAGAVRVGGGEAEVVAATADECERRFVQRLYAAGVDRVVRVTAAENAEQPSPGRAAAALHSFFRAEGGFTVVLAGCMTGPFEHGRTPGLFAAMAGIPCLPRVMDIEAEGDRLRITGRTDGGTYSCRIAAASPCVCALGDARHAYLRMPTLRERLAVDKKVEETFPVPSSGTAIPEFRFVGARHDGAERECAWIEGVDAVEKARALWERHLKDYAR